MFLIKYNTYNTIECTIVIALVDLLSLAARVSLEKIVFGVENAPQVTMFCRIPSLIYCTIYFEVHHLDHLL